MSTMDDSARIAARIAGTSYEGCNEVLEQDIRAALDARDAKIRELEEKLSSYLCRTANELKAEWLAIYQPRLEAAEKAEARIRELERALAAIEGVDARDARIAELEEWLREQTLAADGADDHRHDAEADLLDLLDMRDRAEKAEAALARLREGIQRYAAVRGTNARGSRVVFCYFCDAPETEEPIGKDIQPLHGEGCLAATTKPTKEI